MKKLFIVLLILLTSVGCNRDQGTIIIPKNAFIEPFSNKLCDLSIDSHSNYIILVFIDGDCSTCVADMLNFKKYAKNNSLDENSIFYIVRTDIIARFEYYLENLNFSSRILIDQNNLFFEYNPEINPNTKILLLDKKLKIRYSGSTLSEKTKKRLLTISKKLNR